MRRMTTILAYGRANFEHTRDGMIAEDKLATILILIHLFKEKSELL